MYRAADSFYIYVAVCACVYDLISPEINFKVWPTPWKKKERCWVYRWMQDLCGSRRTKQLRWPQSFRPTEVNSNLHSSRINDMSWKINLKTSSQNDHTHFPKSDLWSANMHQVPKASDFWNQLVTRTFAPGTCWKKPSKLFRPWPCIHLYRGCNKQTFLFASLCTAPMYQQLGFSGLV